MSPRARRALVRDFAIIVGTWAIAAPFILWLATRVVGPALLERIGS